MGKTRYGAFDKILTAKELLALLRRKKKVKRAKLLRFYYCQQIVDFKGVEVKLFFFKTSRKGNWNAVMTTNTKLTFEEAYKIYSNRWLIEVYLKKLNSILDLVNVRHRTLIHKFLLQLFVLCNTI